MADPSIEAAWAIVERARRKNVREFLQIILDDAWDSGEWTMTEEDYREACEVLATLSDPRDHH